MKISLFFVFSLLFSLLAVVRSDQTQKSCFQCCRGVNGNPGNPGNPGLPGPYGRDGMKGETGTKGAKGDVGAIGTSNWKQCAWNKGDGRDNGLIKDCSFKKMHNKTSLRVFYSGSLSIEASNRCCKRWFFTFNGAECSGPIPISGLVWSETSREQPLRVRHLEGYCENIPRGVVRVGFNVGNCRGYGNVNAYTGWNSVSRIVIEEVPAPQK